VDTLRRDHFKDEEIQRLLHRNEEQLRIAWIAWRQSLWAVPSRWTCENITDAVIAFVNATGAWPRDRDFNNRNGLPSAGVFRYHNQPEHWCWGEWRALVKEHRVRTGDRSWPGGHPWPNRDADRVAHPDIWERIVPRAAELTGQAVLSIPNQVHRRDAIEAYGGFAKLATDGAGRLIQQDDYGKLWRIDAVELGTHDWFSMFVEVVNSTPRMIDDGSGTYVLDLSQGKPVYDHYFLRVPPTITTAKLAVAWTGHFEINASAGEAKIDGKEFAGFAAQS
jgi:hypothetical protein